MRDLPKRQSEHSWSEERASRLGYTGWDMLALGCNVLIGGRRNTGPPTLIPGGGRSFPTTECGELGSTLHVQVLDDWEG